MKTRFFAALPYRRINIKMKYFIYQGSEHDCGFTALKMYLAMLAKDKSYLYIHKPSKRESHTLDELALIAEKYGVELEAHTATKSYYDSLEVPAITLIDEYHSVVVVKRTKRFITYYDPGRGKIKISKDEFLRRWKCVLLLAAHPEVVGKIPRIRQHLLPAKLEIISNAISLASAALLITTFYVLNSKENFLYSLIFICSFVLFQIIDRILLYKQVHAFDLEYIPRYFGIKQNCTRPKYMEYIDYKRMFFNDRKQVIAEVLLAFCITFLLCLNDFRNVFVLLALILLKVLEILVFSKAENDRKNRIAELESRAFIVGGDTKASCLEANVKADGAIFSHSLKEIFYIFACFIFAITMMFLTGNSGCNYVIFHFVMYYAGFNAYNTMLNALSNRKDDQKAVRRFFEACNL